MSIPAFEINTLKVGFTVESSVFSYSGNTIRSCWGDRMNSVDPYRGGLTIEPLARFARPVFFIPRLAQHSKLCGLGGE